VLAELPEPDRQTPPPQPAAETQRESRLDRRDLSLRGTKL